MSRSLTYHSTERYQRHIIEFLEIVRSKSIVDYRAGSTHLLSCLSNDCLLIFCSTRVIVHYYLSSIIFLFDPNLYTKKKNSHTPWDQSIHTANRGRGTTTDTDEELKQSYRRWWDSRNCETYILYIVKRSTWRFWKS